MYISAVPTASVSPVTAGSFMDAILLSFSDKAEDSRYVDDLIQEYRESVRTSQQTSDEVIQYYVAIIHQIRESKASIADWSSISLFGVRLAAEAHDYPALAELATYIRAIGETAMDSKSIIISRIADARRRVVAAARGVQLTRTARRLMSAASLYTETGRADQLLEIRKYMTDIDKGTTGIDTGAKAVTSIDSRNPDSVRQAFTRVETKFKEGVFKTGLAALNMAMGSAGGFLPGTVTVFGARSHNFKSGMLSKVLVWALLYNPIPVYEDGLQPAAVLISLESEADIVVRDVARNLHISLHRAAMPTSWTVDQCSAFIVSEFDKRGLVFIIERFQPHDFGIEDFIAFCDSMPSRGLRVWTMAVDYLSKMRVNGVKDHAALGEMYSRACNYVRANNYVFFTAHQLSAAADAAVQFQTNQAKKLTEGMLADSSGVMREIDNLFLLKKEVNANGVTCLGIQWGKARYIDDIREAYKYIVYPFVGHLGIVDDYASSYLFTRDVGDVRIPEWYLSAHPDRAQDYAPMVDMSEDSVGFEV